MRDETVALLFVPPWEPVRLRADRAVVVGRNPSCDLPIASSQVSRKHCWVHCEGGDYVVSDLGSTNGTYVNEQRVIGTRALKSGDEIRVGDKTITFCIADSSFGSLPGAGSDSQTAIFAHETLVEESAKELAAQEGGAHEALRGELSEIPAFAVLQLLEIGGKSGRFDITFDGATSVVWFDGGSPVHARHRGTFGLDAFAEISQMGDGQFHFEPNVPTPQVSIELSMAELLLEASRRRDEAVRS